MFPVSLGGRRAGARIGAGVLEVLPPASQQAQRESAAAIPRAKNFFIFIFSFMSNSRPVFSVPAGVGLICYDYTPYFMKMQVFLHIYEYDQDLLSSRPFSCASCRQSDRILDMYDIF